MGQVKDWLRLYWYIPLVIIIAGGFWLWQNQTQKPTLSVTTRQANTSPASTLNSSRENRSQGSSQSAKKSGYVHLKGAVLHPGLYPVTGQTRWEQVVKAAGGLTPEADISQINLAKIASDEESLLIPEKGAAPISSVGTTSVPQDQSEAKVNLNTADATALQAISGIGPKKAADIIAYREAHGGFKTIEELKEVHGIGEKTFETIAPQIMVGP